jgi:hypothetical protein
MICSRGKLEGLYAGLWKLEKTRTDKAAQYMALSLLSKLLRMMRSISRWTHDYAAGFKLSPSPLKSASI